MLVLGIESTCDETSFALVRDGKQVVSHTISSQIDLHAQFGGVVPELACRRHIDIALPLLKQTLEEGGIKLEEVDLIAVAKGPGLIGPLMIGINIAKGLSFALNKPFVGVNHVEAHLYAALMEARNPRFPALGVVISGGHTLLLKIEKMGAYELLGGTIDDAIGEAFDKVAALLGLPYPGGPQIEALAKKGNPSRYPFKSGQVKGKPLSFSFSGLKTAALYAAKGQGSSKHSPLKISEEDKKDLAASFQRAAFEDLISKTKKAAVGCHSIIFGGGVSSSQTLRQLYSEACKDLDLYWPASLLSLDNAAMIASLGYYKRENLSDWSLEPKTRIAF